MRYDEELCKEAVNELLKEYGVSPNWEDGPDPPDYFVEVDNEKYAVEVTSIHGVTELEGNRYTWTQLRNDLLDFGQKICDQIESEVTIKGSYILSLPPLPSLKNQKSKILKSALNYFNSNSEITRAISKVTVFKSKNKVVDIWKIKDTGSSIIPQSLPGGALITKKEEQLSERLKTAIESKIQKLKHFKYPKILVILDLYGFERSKEEWEDRIPENSANFFECIIRVQNNQAQFIKGKISNS